MQSLQRSSTPKAAKAQDSCDRSRSAHGRGRAGARSGHDVAEIGGVNMDDQARSRALPALAGLLGAVAILLFRTQARIQWVPAETP